MHELNQARPVASIASGMRLQQLPTMKKAMLLLLLISCADSEPQIKTESAACKKAKASYDSAIHHYHDVYPFLDKTGLAMWNKNLTELYDLQYTACD